MISSFFSLFVFYFVGGMICVSQETRLFRFLSLGFLFCLFVKLGMAGVQKKILLIIFLTALGFGSFLGILLKKYHENIDLLSQEIEQHRHILVEGSIANMNFDAEKTLINIQIKTIIFDTHKKYFKRSKPFMLVEHDRSCVNNWKYGDCVAILACPQKTNSWNKAYRHYLRRSVSVVCVCRKVVNMRLLYAPKTFSFKRRLSLFRKTLADRFDSYKDDLGCDVVQILKAWTLGMRFGLSSCLKKSFQRSGTYHLFAISGLHVTVVYSLFVALFCRAPLSVFFLLLLVFFSFFPFLTGLGASVIRATLLLLLTQFFQIFGRPLKREQVFFFVLFSMILLNPQKISDWSFQMSFLAIAILLICTDRSSVLLKNRLWTLFFLSACLSLGTMPLTICFFHQWAWGGILANIFVLPLSVFAIYQAFFLIVLGFFKNIFFVSVFIKSILIPLEKMTVETLLTGVSFFGKGMPFSLHLSFDLGRLYFLFILAVVLTFSSRRSSSLPLKYLSI